MERTTVVNHTTRKRWYQKFRQGDFSLEDELRAGHPSWTSKDRNGRIASTAGNSALETLRKLKRSL